MKIKILNIQQAYELYVLLKPYFPEYGRDTDLLDFLRDFLTSIDEDTLLEVFDLFLGEEAGRIYETDRVELLGLLVNCFEQNKVVALMSFFTEIVHDR